MKKQILTAAMALISIATMAQEKVRVHNGNDSYVTTIEQITFDVTDADQAISVGDLQKENATLATEKTALENQVTTLATDKATLSVEKATMATEKAALENKVSTLTIEKATLATEKTALESQVSTLASEKATLVADTAALKSQISTLATDTATLKSQVNTLATEKATLASEKTTLEGQVSTLTTEKATLASEKAVLQTDTTSLYNFLKSKGLTSEYATYVSSLSSNEHAYVDLGLTSGTLWATCNIGATNPEDYGDYYAWGETETKSNYNWSTYKYMDHSKDSWKGCTKYTFADGQTEGVWYDSDGNFIGDNKTELDDADDVAVQLWGGSWKMPTVAQQDELRNECYWVWTNTYNGKSVSGYIVYKAKSSSDKGVKITSGNTPSSNYNVATDAHIFLPAAGYRWDADLSFAGDFGFFWSRSLYTGNSGDAYNLSFGSDDVWDSLSYYRGDGFSVRAVCAGAQE